MIVVYLRFDQTSAGGFDDLDGLLCVQRRLKFNSSWNETVVFAAELTARPLFFQAKLTNHVQRTRLITPSTDEHYPLDSEDDRSGCMSKPSVTNNSSFQNLLPPGRSHYTNNTSTFEWLFLLLVNAMFRFRNLAHFK